MPRHSETSNHRLALCSATVVLLASVAFQADAGLNEEWKRVHDTTRFDRSSHVRTDSHGNITMSTDSSGAIAVVSYSASGTIRWSDTLDTPMRDSPEALEVDDSGNVWLGGTIGTNLHGQVFVQKYGANGLREWKWESSDTNILADRRMAIARDAAGSLLVSAVRQRPGSATNEVLFIRIGADGEVLWTTRWAAPTNRIATVRHAALDSANRAIVIAETRGVDLTPEVVILRSSADGTALSATSHSLLNTAGFLNDAKIDKAGNVYLLASVQMGNPLRYHYYTAKFNPAGALLWSATRAPTDAHRAVGRAMFVSPDGSVSVTGYQSYPLDDDDDSYETITLRYRPDGELLWAARHPMQSSPVGIVSDSTGRTWIAGVDRPFSDLQGTFLIEYSANGSRTAVRRLPDSADWRPDTLALALDDSLLLATSQPGTGGYDSVLRKFNTRDATPPLTASVYPGLAEIPAGSTITLRAAHSTSQPAHYQWFYYGTRLLGTNATLTVTNVQNVWGSIGDYTVLVSNATHTALSAEARVAIANNRNVLSHIELSGDRIMVEWPAAYQWRLQSKNSMSPGGWTDVPGTLGAGRVELPISESNQIFRLYRP